ncbi:MAG: signal peptidase I, partial [Acidimicrobiia bacterium]|nr:signal peptidase I [Acidimicrobiia bacterium]
GEIAAAGPNQPKDVIKRVIALAGETIEIRESKVFINDEELVEPYLEPGLVMPDFGPVTVPDGFLFVMGDNRNLSSDSRGELGPIAEDRVVGRAFVLFWPVNRVSRL